MKSIKIELKKNVIRENYNKEIKEYEEMLSDKTIFFNEKLSHVSVKFREPFYGNLSHQIENILKGKVLSEDENVIFKYDDENVLLSLWYDFEIEMPKRMLCEIENTKYIVLGDKAVDQYTVNLFLIPINEIQNIEDSGKFYMSIINIHHDIEEEFSLGFNTNLKQNDLKSLYKSMGSLLNFKK